MISVKMLPAQQGDCIILEFGPDRQNTSMIIIDSGKGKECTRKLQGIIQKRTKEDGKSVNLLVLTHYDFDHIGGFINLFSTDLINNNSIEEMWFNFGQALSDAVNMSEIFTISVPDSELGTNVGHGVELHKAISKKQINTKSFIAAGLKYEIYDAKITILSPSIQQLKDLVISGGKQIAYDSQDLQTANIAGGKDFGMSLEDAAKQSFSEQGVTPENKSSIAFLFEYDDKKLLFLGDAVSSQIRMELMNLGYSEENPIVIDACKVMHHGSEHNTSEEFIKVIDCKNFLISGKWGIQRPTKACLSRIVLNSTGPINFYCNYPCGKMFTDEEIENYAITISNIGESELIF